MEYYNIIKLFWAACEGSTILYPVSNRVAQGSWSESTWLVDQVSTAHCAYQPESAILSQTNYLTDELTPPKKEPHCQLLRSSIGTKELLDTRPTTTTLFSHHWTKKQIDKRQARTTCDKTPEHATRWCVTSSPIYWLSLAHRRRLRPFAG